MAVAQDLGAEQKAKVVSILKDLKKESKGKRATYEIALPVATAGARGVEIRQADKFAVIWPDAGITPVTALAANLEYAADHAEKADGIRSQIDEFKKAFPEYADNQLLKALAETIPQAK